MLDIKDEIKEEVRKELEEEGVVPSKEEPTPEEREAEEEKQPVEPAEDAPVEEPIEEEEPLVGEGLSFKGGFDDEETSFKMYEKFHTHEDADPYIDDELLLVCDGTGGAGAFKHHIPSKYLDSLEKIKKIVLPEDTNGCLDNHLKTLFKPVLESSDEIQNRTTAFFASRIVLPRFIYAMKLYEHDKKEEIVEFVANGLRKFAKKFDLRKDVPDNPGNALLPTTLVAININKETEEEVDFDVYCAGDSRAYMISQEGLQQLSQDDEADESITNYFAVKKEPIILNSRHYCMKKPCILFVCSDGIFDAAAVKDYLKLEYALLGYMAESSSMSMWRDKLQKELYSRVKGDDCTIALRSFGYTSYQEMAGAYKERVENDQKLFMKQRESQVVFEVKNHPEYLTQKVDVLVSRTIDKYSEIIDALKAGYEKNPEDAFISQMSRRLDVSDKVDEESQAILNTIDKCKNNIIKELESFLNAALYDIDFYEVFNRRALDEEQAKDLDRIINKIENVKAYNRPKTVIDEIWDILYEIYKSLSSYLNAEIGKTDPKSIKFRFYNSELSPDIKEFLVSLNRKDLVDKYEEAYQARLETGIRSINKYAQSIVYNIHDFLNDNKDSLAYIILKPINEDVARDLAELRKSSEEFELRTGVIYKIKGLYNSKTGPREIVNDRLKLGSGVRTIIDNFYNPAILQKALQYYEAQNDPDDFTAIYNEFVRNATKYIA